MPHSKSVISGDAEQSNDVYPLIQTLLYDTPLMIAPSKADVLHQVLQGYAVGRPPSVDAAAFQSNTQNKPYSVTTGGVAVIPVYGTLTHRAGFLDAMSGITSYKRIGAYLRMAKNDADVKGVLLEGDTPGGAVAGLFELADVIELVRQSKPVWSISNENMFSAGYAIGSSTDRIIAPKTAMVGSVGVIMMHLDQSKFDEKSGRKYTPIYAGHHKIDGSSHAPLSQQAKDGYQNIVDQNFSIFVAHVAAGRGMSEAAVIDTQAQIYTAKDAIDVGFIDEIATFEETLNMLEDFVKPSVSLTLASASHTTESTMTTETKGTESKFSQADLDAARKEGREDGLKAGIDQERTRVSAILDHDKAGANFAQAKNAITTGLTAEQATGVLAAMPEVKPEASGNSFTTVMDAMGNPNVSADSGDDSDLTVEQLAAQAVSYFQS